MRWDKDSKPDFEKNTKKSLEDGSAKVLVLSVETYVSVREEK